MLDQVKKRYEEIKSLCLKHRIAKLWLFGSAVFSSEFREDSDLDFLFSYDDEGTYHPSFPYVDSFLDLKEDLESLFRRKVDLVAFKKFRNPYFNKSVEETKVLIYAKDSTKVSI